MAVGDKSKKPWESRYKHRTYDTYCVMIRKDDPLADRVAQIIADSGMPKADLVRKALIAYADQHVILDPDNYII